MQSALRASVDRMPNDLPEYCNAPAFPQGLNSGQPPGLTKREWMAAMCLQGILSNKSMQRSTIWSVTQAAVMYAEQLLDCLDGKTPEDPDLLCPDRLTTGAGARGE